MVKTQQHELPTSKPCSHKRRHHRGKPAHREEEGQLANGSVESHHFRLMMAEPQAWEEDNPCHLTEAQHPPKVK